MGLGGALTVATVAVPAFADPNGGGEVIVAPKSGPANTSIAVEYRLNGMGGVCAPMQVTFKWDGRAVGPPVPFTKNCVAKWAFKPPKDDRNPGLHLVTASGKGGQLGQTAFLVTTGDPSGSPSASASASASPSRSRSAKPSASPSDDPVVVDPPLPTDNGPSVDGTVAAAGPPGNGQDGSGSGSGGISSIGIALAFGGVLVLGGVVILGFIVFRGRRDDDDLEPAVLGESPTQPIPGFSGFVPYQPGPSTTIEPVLPPPVPE
jgi:hypothetical protein